MILAKSEPKETLLEHTENALSVFKSIKEAYPETPKICGVFDFWEHLFVSIFLHDFGKAATGFQKSLNGGKKWGYRHEILSSCFISGLDYDEKTKNSIVMAVITHHRDVEYLREKHPTISGPGYNKFKKYMAELEPNLGYLNDMIEFFPDLSKKYLGSELNNFKKIDSIDELVNSYKIYVLEYRKKVINESLTESDKKYGVFLKGFLTACDHLSSSGHYEILNAIENMRSVYYYPELRKAQEKALKTIGDAFLVAPTGSGKTEASLFWSDVNQNELRSRRVFYLLPYTASINAMYERLSKDFESEDREDSKELVGIQHGKVSYYLYNYFEDVDYEIAAQKAREIKNLTKKIYRPYKISTPHQILKSSFGVKGFEQSLSEMSDGLFILDEIHSYDARTTALLLETLKILKGFGANFFIMSATLPSFIKNMFIKELGITNEISYTDEELDTFTRHEVFVIEGNINDNLDRIIEELEAGNKVLVVCNTVNQAQNVYRSLSEHSGNSRLIHGRFIVRDREEIEKELKTLDLLVGTQAVEVSLDIDYDILFSEPAPLDALIQRFGRINRKGWSENKIKPVCVFEEGSENDKYIYNQDLVKKSVDLLRNEGILKESRIQGLVDEVYSEGYTGKDLDTFNRVREFFPRNFNNVNPFFNDKMDEKEFYSLFDNIEIVPLTFKDEYINEIENKRYFEAMKYTTSIGKGRFKRLIYEGRIFLEDHIFYADVKYDSELGLLLNEKEEMNNII